MFAEDAHQKIDPLRMPREESVSRSESLGIVGMGNMPPADSSAYLSIKVSKTTWGRIGFDFTQPDMSPYLPTTEPSLV